MGDGVSSDLLAPALATFGPRRFPYAPYAVIYTHFLLTVVYPKVWWILGIMF